MVQQPVFRPHACAVTGRTEDREGFVDTGATIPVIDPHVYVSAAGVRMLMRAFGWPSPDEYARVCRELALSKERLEELELKCRAQEEQLEAIAVLKRYGARSERKPGRPPKSKQESNGKVAA